MCILVTYLDHMYIFEILWLDVDVRTSSHDATSTT